MARFFVNPDQIQDSLVYIDGEDVKHINKVLRLQPGEKIVVCDGRGQDYQVKLTEVNRDQVVGHIMEQRLNGAEPPLEVILVQGLPKGDKMELIIQKCTELGVSRVIPVAMERSVVQLNAKKAGSRRERWQKVAAEAAKQCQRGRIPMVDELCTFRQLWDKIPEDAKVIMPWEVEHEQGLKKGLNCMDKPISSGIYIIIGPEGGISPSEAESARANGTLTVSLGPRILRTETAGLAVLSILMYQLGDMGGLWNGESTENL